MLASDSELTIKVFIPNVEIKHIEGKGRVIIHSKSFIEIVRNMPDNNDITFETDDNYKIKVTSEKNLCYLNGFNPNDYPNINIDITTEPIVLKSNILREIINQTSYALSTQEKNSNIIFTGMNLKINGDLLECIATDIYRLAKKNIKLNNYIDKNINIIIPGKSIIELEKILTEEDDVEIHLFNNKILFIYKNINLQTNLLSGTYPDTSHFIADNFKYMINLNLKEFYNAINTATLFLENKEKNIVKMQIEDKEMVITSASDNIGNFKRNISIDSNNKEKIEMSFNSKYMLEALRVINDENILLLLNLNENPILIKPITDETLIELILPIKTY